MSRERSLLLDGRGPGLARLRASPQAEAIRHRVLQQQREAMRTASQSRRAEEGAKMEDPKGEGQKTTVAAAKAAATPTPALGDGDPSAAAKTTEAAAPAEETTPKAAVSGEGEDKMINGRRVPNGAKKSKFTGKKKATAKPSAKRKGPAGSSKRAELMAKKIHVAASAENPRRKDTAKHREYEKLRSYSGKTVQDFVKIGKGKISTVNSAVRRKFAELR